MAQLYYRYSTMNAGKSIDVLKIAHNYNEQDKHVVIFTSALDNRYGKGYVASRIGMKREALLFDEKSNLVSDVMKACAENKIYCVLIDEAQFLTRAQVLALVYVVDELDIPVIAYGLKNDFKNELFPGSEALLCYADKIEELKTICWHCNKKATMVLRMVDGEPVYSGEQISIGGNDQYVSVCRKCYHHPGRTKEVGAQR